MVADNSDGLTLREIAIKYDATVRAVRAWSVRWPEWPPPISSRSTTTRGPMARVYDAAAVDRCIREHRARSDAAGWSLARVAAELGTTPRTIRDGVRAGTFPKPSGMVANWPWWEPATIQDWNHRTAVPEGAWTSSDVIAAGVLRWELDQQGPPPDGRKGQQRWWWPATIHRWQQQRAAAKQNREAVAQRRAAERVATQRAAQDAVATQWSSRDVARATGLSYDTVRTYRTIGRLPTPDGTTPSGRPWWNPKTVTTWDQPAKTGRPRRVP